MGEDERIGVSTHELRTIVELLEVEDLAGNMILTLREGSPWLEFAVAVPYTFKTSDKGNAVGGSVHRYALWRYTCAVYRVGEDGAVEDDPILPARPQEGS